MSGFDQGAAGFFGGNQHNDVLNALPTDAISKARLVEELKRRGNAAFKLGSLPEADVLYSKAIEHDATKELYGNRSMTRYGLGKFQLALEDADQAIQMDESWVKAHYRKAQALIKLKSFDEGEKILKKVLEMDAANTAAKKDLECLPKLRADALAEKARQEERKAKVQENEVISRVVKTSIEDTSSEATTSTASKKDGKAADLSMRGYKVTSDGRKTTFFNRELTEQDKELLKDNKPKAVESAEEIAAKERQAREQGASVWNQAGTFEERGMTDWAKTRLKDLLVGLKAKVQVKDKDGDLMAEEIVVSEIADLDGDASIAFARGKKRHIFSFEFSAKWKFSLDGKNVTGSLFYSDISGDNVQEGEDLEAELRFSNREQQVGPENVGTVVTALTDPKVGLKAAIDKAIFSFALEFRSMN